MATRKQRKISDLRALIIDMDGVLWRGRTFLPGVAEFFAFLRRQDLPFILATNNSTATPDSVVERLATCGALIQPFEVLTSSMATATFLQGRLESGARIHAIGEEAVRDVLDQAGFQLTDSTQDVDAVVVGFDRDISWLKLTKAALAIQSGALFVGTNPDTSFPIEQGQAPGNGAFVTAIEVTTRVKPIIVGKPEPLLYQQAAAQLQVPAEEILVVGDRLETDILGAVNAGMPSVLLLTGVTTEAQASTSDINADWTMADLPTLVKALGDS